MNTVTSLELRRPAGCQLAILSTQRGWDSVRVCDVRVRATAKRPVPLGAPQGRPAPLVFFIWGAGAHAGLVFFASGQPVSPSTRGTEAWRSGGAAHPDRYHIVHHEQSRCHWSLMPQRMVDTLDRHAAEDALVFRVSVPLCSHPIRRLCVCVRYRREQQGFPSPLERASQLCACDDAKCESEWHPP